jgi:hypothetical protein
MTIVLYEETALSFDAIYPYVLPSVKGAALPLVDIAIAEAMAEFTRRTQVWEDELDVFQTEEGASVYEVPLPVDTIIAKLIDVNVGAQQYALVNRRDARRNRLDGMTSQTAMLTGQHQITLYPVPSTVVDVSTEAVLCTELTARSIPGVLTEYLSDLAHGVLGRLMDQSGKAWTDHQQAATKLARFNQRIKIIGLRTSINASASRPWKEPDAY